jgi:hypothetical protein
MGLPFFSSIHRSSPYLRRYIIGYDSKVSSINGNKETVCTAADARRGVETACRILAVSGEGLGKSASMSVTYDEEEI